MINPLTGEQAIVAAAGGWVPRDYRWTEAEAGRTLPETDVAALVKRVDTSLAAQHVILPDQDLLLRRCVTALLVGHVILQGPPGTGKTTLARALAEAFQVELMAATATSEWSPFHVVGGLQPDTGGGFEPRLGFVPQAALRCAELSRKADGDPAAESAGCWLLIDEFNRADVDKAIGGLYTLLSSCDPSHTKKTPLELWFEQEDAAVRLWVPALFRIVGTMNDLDTNYVSPMSQGLRRRFQFITVGVPGAAAKGEGLTEETQTAFEGASQWLFDTYAITRGDATDETIGAALSSLQQAVSGLRHPEAVGVDSWPVGTAQVVDVLRSFLLMGPDEANAMDMSVADRLVGQMNTITEAQYKAFGALFDKVGWVLAKRELDHMWKPYSTGHE